MGKRKKTAWAIAELAYQLEQRTQSIQLAVAHGFYDQMSGRDAAVSVTDSILKHIKDEEFEVEQRVKRR